jgi:hypothetical protein
MDPSEMSMVAVKVTGMRRRRMVAMMGETIPPCLSFDTI